jgi:hypothetical protein
VVLDALKSFSSIVCESVRKNVIDLAVSTNSLLFVLKYISSCVFCAIRLSKRDGGPILRFEFNFVDTGNCVVVHDIPVEVLNSDTAWSEPILADPDVQLALTHKTLRLPLMLEKWKHLGVAECAITLVNRESAVGINLIAQTDSAKVTVMLTEYSQNNEPKFAQEGTGSITLNMTLSGLCFIFTKLANLSTTKAVLMASQSKYASVWLQLPYSYGVVAAVSPAIIMS